MSARGRQWGGWAAVALVGGVYADEASKELKELKGLRTLYLSRTKVTGAGLKELQAALPHCRINSR
jgi:hypothetical protein